MTSRPNILYIHSHDTGRYVQPYGHGIPTPHIQKLAEQGVLFRDMHNAGPTCSPSRAALLTGQSPHASGMIGLAHRGFRLNDYGEHIVNTLKASGYYGARAGVQHVAPYDAAHEVGYDELIDTGPTKAEDVGHAAARWLGGYDRQEPFFLAVGFGETHRTFRKAGQLQDERYCMPPAPLPDTPETRRDMANFQATARAYDSGVGLVMDALKEHGLEEDTLVVCTTDHGIAFPSMKCNLTNHGTGVMFIMRGPGGFEGGKVVDALCSQIDLFPTLCDLLEIDPPHHLAGTSMMPLVRGKADQVNEAVFSEVTYHAAYEPMRNCRTKKYNYIRRYDDRRTQVLPNCDESPSKTVWLDSHWPEREPAEEQLYDLTLDPIEVHNVADDPAYAEVLNEMRGRLDAWMEETNDPILKGLPVPAPKGAKVNDPDGQSPKEEPYIVE
jgi:arylsulfatase A-like enzyme